MPRENTQKEAASLKVHELARRILASFVFTFIASRVVVILIMTRKIPDLYLYAGGTHIHHLNYGIFLLAGVGAYLLFKRPKEHGLSAAAVLYGIGLALTFDEFGMWLHLTSIYWQRASFDAIMVIGGLLGLIGFAPRLKRFRPHHWATAIALGVAVVVFSAMLVYSLKYAGRVFGPELRKIEDSAPK